MACLDSSPLHCEFIPHVLALRLALTDGMLGSDAVPVPSIGLENLCSFCSFLEPWITTVRTSLEDEKPQGRESSPPRRLA